MSQLMVGQRSAKEGERLTLVKEGDTWVWVSNQDVWSYPPYAAMFNKIGKAIIWARNLLRSEVNYHVQMRPGTKLLLNVHREAIVELYDLSASVIEVEYQEEGEGRFMDWQGRRLYFKDLGKGTGVKVIEILPGADGVPDSKRILVEV